MQPFAGPGCSTKVAARHLTRDTRPNLEAMRTAFEQHYATLLKLCMALSGRRQVAEDIVQEAFVRSAPHVGRLSPDETGPYLRQVVVNLWRNRLRRLMVEVRHREPPRSAEHLEPADSFAERDELWAALGHLPDRQRTCVVLRHYVGLSEREVAQALRCSTGTVKSQTARGLMKLRRELQDGH
jgi:RNA polymerase sigma-70 factor (sigma-E family)